MLTKEQFEKDWYRKYTEHDKDLEIAHTLSAILMDMAKPRKDTPKEMSDDFKWGYGMGWLACYEKLTGIVTDYMKECYRNMGVAWESIETADDFDAYEERRIV